MQSATTVYSIVTRDLFSERMCICSRVGAWCSFAFVECTWSFVPGYLHECVGSGGFGVVHVYTSFSLCINVVCVRACGRACALV